MLIYTGLINDEIYYHKTEIAKVYSILEFVDSAAQIDVTYDPSFSNCQGRQHSWLVTRCLKSSYMLCSDRIMSIVEDKIDVLMTFS